MRDRARLYRRKKNGRELPTWWCEYYDPNGHRVQRSTGCRDRRAAEIKARELERSAADPAHAAAHATTLKKALDQILPDRVAKGCAKKTLEMYASKAGHFLRLWGAEMPLAQVDAAKVDDFIAARLGEGAARTTLGKELTTLRVALKLARRRGQYHRTLDEVMPEWSLNYVPGTRFLSHEEFQRLMPELPADRGAHVCFLIATGADWSPSLLAIRKDIDLVKNRVQVGGTKTPTRARTVPVAFAWQRALLEHVIAVRGAPGPLFRGWGNVSRDLAAACKRAGIDSVTPRDLRRTFSQWQRAEGVPPSLIAPTMGHADARMVERVYGKVTTDDLARQLAAFAGADDHLVLTLAGNRLTFSREPTEAELALLRRGLQRCHASVTPRCLGGAEDAGSAEPTNAVSAGNSVPRVGIEPTTRGFSVPLSRREYRGVSRRERGAA